MRTSESGTQANHVFHAGGITKGNGTPGITAVPGQGQI
jgi:phage terminase large subunit-like protein